MDFYSHAVLHAPPGGPLSLPTRSATLLTLVYCWPPTNSQILSTPGSFTYTATFAEHRNTQHFFLNHSFPRPPPTPALTKMQRLARCRVAFLEFLGRTRVNVLFYGEFLGLLLAQHQLLLAGGAHFSDLFLLLHYTRQLCHFSLGSW